MERRRILVVAAALVAVLGVVLVLLYVRGSDSRAKAQYNFTSVLVATQTIPQGETFGDAVKAGKLDMQNVVSTDKISDAVTSLTQISNEEVAQSTIYPGEQVLAPKFNTMNADTTATPELQIPDGDVAITVSLTDPGRVAGFVQPGSSVALFVTSSTTSSDGTVTATSKSVSRVLLPKVLVLAVGSTAPSVATSPAPGSSAAPESLPNTLLTLAVSQKEAEQILLATAGSANGSSYTLSMGLLNANSKISMGNIVGPTNLFH